MKSLRIAAAAALVLATALMAAPPAQAGGWATTLLDPLPSRLEVGRAYTVGYWVLQHGSHPYEGDLGPTALRLVDDSNVRRQHAGAPLPETAHYAAAIVFPHAGTWRLYARQGIFGTYMIGSVTVPGGVKVLPTPSPMAVDPDEQKSYWGTIHPPGMPGDAAVADDEADTGTHEGPRSHQAAASQGAGKSAVSDAREASNEPAGTQRLWPAVGVVALLLLFAARLARSRQPARPGDQARR